MLTKTKKKTIFWERFINYAVSLCHLNQYFFSLLTIVTMQMQISLNEILGNYVAASF